MTDLCHDLTRTAHKQLESRSPMPLSDLSAAEHQAAQKLAEDTRTLLGGIGAKQSISSFLKKNDAARADMESIIGSTNKNRLDGILADANDILKPADAKLLQMDEGVILGKNRVDGYYMATPITGDFSCKSDATTDLFPSRFDFMHKYNDERALRQLKD